MKKASATSSSNSSLKVQMFSATLYSSIVPSMSAPNTATRHPLTPRANYDLFSPDWYMPMLTRCFLRCCNIQFFSIPTEYRCINFVIKSCNTRRTSQAWSRDKQDGPSLESSSYLNVSLRYLGPWDPWDLGTPGPWNPWTLGLFDFFPPPTPPHNSPYILSPPPISSSYSPPLVWFG